MGNSEVDRPLDSLTYAVAAETFIGGTRLENQDACVAWQGDGWVLLAVADGMGGAAGGAIASERAIGALADLHDWIEQDPAPTSEAIYAHLGTAFKAANETIYQLALDNPVLSGMGTTLVVAIISNDRLFVAHAGDSRAYIISDDSVRLLTRDHSIAQDRPDMWDGNDPVYGRSLTRSVGDTSEVSPTFHPHLESLSAADTVAGVYVVDSEKADDRIAEDHLLKDGQVLVLSSDGVHECLSDRELQACILTAADGTVAARLLIKQAFDNDSTDNMSVALVEIGRIPRQGKLVRQADLPKLNQHESNGSTANPRRTNRMLCVAAGALFLLACASGLFLWSSLHQRKRPRPIESIERTSGQVLKMLTDQVQGKNLPSKYLPRWDQRHSGACPNDCGHPEYCAFVKHLKAAERIEAKSDVESPEHLEHLESAEHLIPKIIERSLRRSLGQRGGSDLPPPDSGEPME
jgi:PPM family protein phosphatase